MACPSLAQPGPSWAGRLGLASYDNAAFAGFNKQTDAYVNNGYVSITVDLGEKYSLNKLVARVSTATETNVGAGVKNIANVDFYVSDDGASWKKAAVPDGSSPQRSV